MTTNSNIEWCDHTFNYWIGCTKVSPACDNCYAERSMPAKRFNIRWGVDAPRHLTKPSNLRQPKRWERDAEKFFAEHGRRQRVFCSSLSDVFDMAVPQEWRHQLFDMILETPSLDWLLLTKRIGNAAEMFRRYAQERGIILDAKHGVAPNIWLGATVISQAEADRDIRKLLDTPATLHFLSMEPLLGSVDLTSVAWPGKDGHRVDVLRAGYWNKSGFLACGPAAGLGEPRGGFTNHSDMESRIDWVIVGGESGMLARPMHPHWARSLRDQCAEARTPFMFKQWGAWYPERPMAGGDLGGDLRRGLVRHMMLSRSEDGHFKKDDAYMRRSSKKATGRLLDGVEHNEFPTQPNPNGR